MKPRFHPFRLRPEQVEDTRDDRWDVDLHARDHLAALEWHAKDTGVLFDGVAVTNDHPWEAIVEVAMASHGRTGIVSLIPGSQAQRVHAHGGVPVLIYRP